MKKKLFLRFLCLFTFYSLFFTVVYSMKNDSSSEDDIINFFPDQDDITDTNCNSIINNDIQSNDQQLNLTIEQIFKLSEEELKEMSQENLRTISTQVCQYIEKIMQTVTQDVDNGLVNDLKEYFETLGKLKKNTRALIDPQILILIIEQLPGIITSIENALQEVEGQIETETENNKVKMPEFYEDTSPLKVKRDRLKCLLIVLKPSFVILVGGVVIAYNMGWFPVTISETIQNYVLLKCKSWFF